MRSRRRQGSPAALALRNRYRFGTCFNATPHSGLIHIALSRLSVCTTPCSGVPFSLGYFKPDSRVVDHSFVRPGVCRQLQHDGWIGADELFTLANIALGNAGASDREVGDANLDGQITVNGILTAVSSRVTRRPAP